MKNWKKKIQAGLSILLSAAMIAGNSAMAFAQDSENVDITNGMIAYYDFESGTANKVDSEKYAGTLNGSATIGNEDDNFGTSLKIGSSDGGMQIMNILNAAKTSFSVSMWYKANAVPGNKNVNLLQAGEIGGASGRTILILSPQSKYYTYLTADEAKVQTAEAVAAVKWQHITFVYDKDASKAYFYVNGVADNAQGVSLSGTPVDTDDLIIGRHRSDGSGHLNGSIDEVRIYNKAISAAEAQAIYNDKAVVETPVTDLTLTVNTDEIERKIDSDSIFGINHRYAFNGYGSFDSKEMKVKEDFKALYEEVGFGSIRYPGGTISNLFNWKATIGPVEERKNQIHGFYNNSGQGGIAPNFGIGEIATFADDVDSEIVYVYSLGRGNAQDAEDLIEYLNAKVGTNPNGGIDWAAVRAENGHPAPYNVRYFEIGNEMQQVYSDGTTSQGYWLHGVGDKEVGYIDGGLASFTKQYAVCEEDWNAVASQSDGSANMVRYMRYANVNPKMYDENGKIVDDPNVSVVEKDSVAVFVGSEEWTIVDNFENSTAADKHVMVDYSTGAILFGDGVKGAIPAKGTQIYVSYKVDRDGFLDISKALKETTEAINKAEGTTYEAYVYSSYETEGFIKKMADRNADEWYDGLTIHPYSGGPSGSGTAFYDNAMSLGESNGVAKVQRYVDMLPEDKVPVISEYGIYNSTNPLLRTQTHAVYIAKVLMEYVRLGSPYIQKHCLIDWYSSGGDSLGPTQQAVIQAVSGSDADRKTGEGTFTFFSTPSARVFQMLNAGFGDYVLPVEFSSMPTMDNGVKELSALASRDNEGNVYIAAVNVDREEDHTFTINLEGASDVKTTVEVQLLSTDTYDAENTPENPDNVVVENDSFEASANQFTFTLPKHSVAILKVADAVGETVDKEDLAKAIASAEELEEAYFTAESWETFAAVLADAKAVNNDEDASNDEVKEALNELKEAIADLESNGIANKTELTALIEEVKDFKEKNYTEETWKVFAAALAKAQEVAEDKNAVQGDVNGAKIALRNAAAALIEKGSDPTDDSLDMELSKITYSTGSEQSQSGSEGPIRFAFDGDVTTYWHSEWTPSWSKEQMEDYLWVQFDFKEATVVDAIRYLPRPNAGNGTITGYRVEAKLTADGDWTTLTEGTWGRSGQTWQLARFEATEVAALRLVATDTYADSTTHKFASAAELRVRLGELSSDETVTVEKAALEAAIEAAEELEADVYTAETWEAFAEALEAAKAVNEDAAATQEAVDKALADLAAAQEALEEKPAPVVNPFEDVKEADYYYAPVLWAVENGITTGTSATTFSPEDTCTRGAVVTFLWRAAGCPEPEEKETAFVDITEADYYYKAVLWAVEEGITTGTSATTFAPNEGCTRGQVVTFLFRAAKEEVPADAENAFTDVVAGAYYEDAVLWAVANGITTGTSATTFEPGSDCTRGQIVTFIYRAAQY